MADWVVAVPPVHDDNDVPPEFAPCPVSVKLDVTTHINC